MDKVTTEETPQTIPPARTEDNFSSSVGPAGQRQRTAWNSTARGDGLGFMNSPAPQVVLPPRQQPLPEPRPARSYHLIITAIIAIIALGGGIALIARKPATVTTATTPTATKPTAAPVAAVSRTVKSKPNSTRTVPPKPAPSVREVRESVAAQPTAPRTKSVPSRAQPSKPVRRIPAKPKETPLIVSRSKPVEIRVPKARPAARPQPKVSKPAPAAHDYGKDAAKLLEDH